jgi:murein DD-endopeptidase MepM/ murein hydrolase activator NlpD
LRLTLILIFFAVTFASISFVFYSIEQALKWAEPVIVSARENPPNTSTTFALGKRNFFEALLEEGITRQDANSVIAALKKTEFDFTLLRPKQRVTIERDYKDRPVRVRYGWDKISTYLARRLADGTYVAGRHEIPTIRKTVTIAGAVESTVYGAILKLGEEVSLTAKFIEIFGWDIDFSSDTQRGDTFVLILEKIETESGEPVGYGKLFAGQYNGSSVGLKRGFHFDHPDKKHQGFYTENGDQMKQFMLRAPLNTLRVSSRFGFRMHPTLHRRKKHNGIDYKAPTGTPVWAAADGVIRTAGRSGAAGKMVVIDHGDGLQSYYMHLSRIHVRTGQKVSQRKAIGRVGSTGRSTGPHLHFGLKYKGKWINPRKKKFGKPKKLDTALMPDFQKIIEELSPVLESVAASIPPLPKLSAEPEIQGEADAPFSEAGSD